MTFVERVEEFVARIRYFMPLAGGILNALRIIISIRKDPQSLQSIYYKGALVKFRGCDEQVIREVLHDEEYGFLKDFINHKKAPKILDIGGHIGTFGIWVLSINPTARILSVEADPSTYKVALRNVSEQVNRGARWTVINKAAVDRDGVRVRILDSGPSMSHRIHPEGELEVEGISLFSLIEKIRGSEQTVHLVKIDIEGAEEIFLYSGKDSLKRVRALVVELHPGLCDTERVERLLKNSFDSLKRIAGRTSTKPLLFCQNMTIGT